MQRFDGVALLALENDDSGAAGSGASASEAAGSEAASSDGSVHPRRWHERLGHTLVDDGPCFVVRFRPGVPDALRDTRGRWVAAVALRAAADEPRPVPPIRSGPRTDETPERVAPDARSRGPGGDECPSPRALAILPPAPTAGLLGCRPLTGGRTHVALFGQAMTLCGRLPVAGEPIDPGLVDCLRCLRSDVITERFAEQLAHHDRLLELADPLTAAALAGWWPRLDHRDPDGLPLLLDAMVGARIHALPGAVDDTEALRRIRRHREVASEAVRAWAVEQARPRLEQQLRRLLLDTSAARQDAVRRELALAGALLDAADVAETLVVLLEQHGPVPSLEALVLAIARRAGDDASDRVQRWRRVHAVAAALAPGRHSPRPKPIIHDRLHAHQRTPLRTHR